MAKIAYFLLFGFFASVLVTPIYAAIFINEFASDVASGENEWVEFYNPEPDNQPLSGWILEQRTGSDLSGTASHQLDSITVPANGFASYEFFNSSLNNNGDVLTLKNGSSTIDEIAYGSAQNAQLTASEKEQSAGRQTDGANSWVIFTTPTRDSTNNSSTPLTSPSPTPSPNPTPTPTPSPNPTPAKSPSPTPKSTPSTTIKSPTPTPKTSPEILGQTNLHPPPSLESPTSMSSSPNPYSSSTSKTKIAAILVGSGIIIIGLSIGFYLWYKKVLEHPKEQNKDKL